ncbi:uncharacterized protein LOC114259821 [Camellia sinensis]|uniref:uncharacterized protein LOC114259821 n=1 Tax=Camellia sinensis TaxID=4442 RepID=UPI0010368838|nr:uncharacterized protein LOC114259821 [Camellia sinensis]
MSHPDHETRVGPHHVFSIVLMPSLICPWLVRNGGPAQALLGFSPIASERIKNGSFSIQDESNDKPKEEVSQVLDNGVTQSIKCPSRGRSFSFKNAMVNGKADLTALRLSSHQVSLLLSAIWVQATSIENTPANFEAMAHTYNVTLLFTRNKVSSWCCLLIFIVSTILILIPWNFFICTFFPSFFWIKNSILKRFQLLGKVTLR